MNFNLKINNSFLWIGLAVLIKGLFFWTHVYSNYPANHPYLGYYVYDSDEYYGSVENLMVNGFYEPDNRMPGLGIIYLLLRAFFQKTTILNIILILQWLVSSVAAYVLALTISKAVKRDTVFYFVFFISILTHYLFVWDTFLLSESFCLSFFIFALWFLLRFYEAQQRNHLFWCGFFLTWCVFTRPVFFLFFGLTALFLFIYFVRERLNFKVIVLNFILFFSVFIICDSAWLIRNYTQKGRTNFLNDIDSYSVVSENTPMPALYLFLEAWGGDLENEIHWFELEKVDYSIRDTVLPDHMYTSVFNKDSLLLVKEKFRLWKSSKSDSLTRQLNTSLQNYTASIKNERPFLYYVGSGFIYLKKLVKCGHANYHSVGINSSELPLYKKILRNSRSVLFYIFFASGAFASLLYLRRKNHFLILLTLIAFCNIIYIAFFFRTPEFRYMLPSTLVFICFFSIGAANIWDGIRSRITSVKQ